MNNSQVLELSNYTSKKRVRQIEDIANQLLAEVNQTKPPILVQEILNFKSIALHEIEFEDNDISGVFMTDGKSAAIGVNKLNTHTRKRFTIAHELGHFILGHRRDQVFVDTPYKYYTILYRDKNSSSGEFFQEREANAFAAALLMPREMLLSELREASINQQSLDENFDLIGTLCEKFDVSITAMTLRLTNLDLHW
ncbi:ImmA/IrrE family metallo-endopeptidase [Flectobacillus sp. DC10W]|uniref:ImmA/IrrE family metallo-endopeptidase n=1 Tax=Flectobacillus longus TaxID=2984207 RepID=A0ABT6YLY8_9BACT|nr:ImmA/IrrE family metallo-endopeptidase [Flectobacillus longus]MDI9864474.1 ImmA/IrrE family metallo-endopeptidase [Flectobacillus longus]